MVTSKFFSNWEIVLTKTFAIFYSFGSMRFYRQIFYQDQFSGRLEICSYNNFYAFITLFTFMYVCKHLFLTEKHCIFMYTHHSVFIWSLTLSFRHRNWPDANRGIVSINLWCYRSMLSISTLSLEAKAPRSFKHAKRKSKHFL
mgnify:FL=1